ncbi:hypothetical protein PbJCM13498_04100 [Prolixibacter bellariivorans]|uniref:Citrate lyase ligase C-terminal domain-containing protein n=2 Tax=Prolixibacter bellariivorans TaxID=314319 RepID=A0A5M4AVT8_9BACT|nr:adenylyltransferase/cytidyltransferase family protein [Prolixibacter bellariivorans]GET31547.1 hypothetical protein PbJCM13498_04100 [Prolixibacter bellariivorans]
MLEEVINKESISNYNIPVLKTVIKHVEDNGGRILFVDRPKFPSSNLSKSEKQSNFILWNNRIIKLLYNLRLISNGTRERVTRSYTQSPLIGATPNKLRKNYMVNEDCENKFVRVVNGYRQDTEKELTENRNSIYLFGSSLVYSVGCEDKDTLSSLLGNEIGDRQFGVINRGVFSADVMNSAFAILDTQISKGDIIVLYGLNPLSEKEKTELKKEANFLDLAEIFMRPHSYGNVFFDLVHLTPEGYNAVARFIAKEIKDNLKKRTFTAMNSYSDTEKNIFHKIEQCRFRAALRYIDNDFPHYINFLKSKYKPGNNGIAAMNCNPFTLGHRYLVSTASKMVDTLYVFVVEEDKSYFPFEQRFEMIKEGLKNIANVEVVPTGKFLVSSMTFPDYFSKEEGFNPAMNVAYDFEIFVNYIAPALDLRNRFIGNEPFCRTTRTHHNIMKKTLPQKGISVIEIERLENKFGAISASTVRKLIKDKEFDKLDSFLPGTSIDLLTRFGYLN